MWDATDIEDSNPYVGDRSCKNWEIWHNVPLFVVNVISLALVIIWGCFGIHQDTAIYLNMLLCLLLLIASLAVLIYAKYRHSSLLIALLAIIQGIRLLALLAWGRGSPVQQILASVEYVIIVRIISVAPTEYFGQPSPREINEEPSPLDMDYDMIYIGNHFIIDDNTGMIESPESTHNHHPPGNIRVRKEYDFSSSDGEGEIDDMASGKESIHSDESGTFGEVPLETSRELSTQLSISNSSAPIEEQVPLHEKSSPPPPLFSLSLERYCLILLAVTNAIFCILVSFENKNSPIVNIGIICFSWLTNLFGIMVVVLEILKMQSFYTPDVLFGSTHSHGFSFFVLLGAVFLRILIRVGELAFSISDAIGNGENPFLSYGIESLLVFIPLALHFYTIYSEYSTRNAYRVKIYYDAGRRMELLYYVVLTNLHLIAIGHAFESTSFPSSLLSLSYAFALVSSVDLTLLVIGSLSTFFQLLGQIYNFGFLRHKLHNHKDIACTALFFACFHVLLHVFQWLIDANLQFHAQTIYSAKSPAFITGVLAVFGFFGAGLSGYKNGIHSRLHLPFAALGLVAFFCHSYKGILDSSLGSMVTLSFFVLCASVYTLFFLFFPLQVTKVANPIWEYTESDDQFALLEVFYENANLVPPGSYFNIFGPNHSLMELSRGQPFPVFASQDRRVSFLLNCAKSHNYQNLLEHIVIQKPLYLHVQGPFQGHQSKAFIDYLGALTTPCDIYLCGWSSGVAPLFSLLCYFRENSHYYPIQRISCLITKFSDKKLRSKLRQHFDLLVRNWFSPFPLAIVECPSDDLNFIRDAKKVAMKLYKTKEEEMQSWKEEIPISGNRRWVCMSGEGEREGERGGEREKGGERGRSVNNKKLLFFCGEEFDFSFFPKKEDWQIFVESIPNINKLI